MGAQTTSAQKRHRTYHRGRFVLPKSESTYLIVLAMIPPWMDYFFSMLEAFSLFEFR
jgi:hypothetical protein